MPPPPASVQSIFALGCALGLRDFMGLHLPVGDGRTPIIPPSFPHPVPCIFALDCPLGLRD
jgi:hypothetical protein